jgi:iron complex outermembrane receptor protein
MLRKTILVCCVLLSSTPLLANEHGSIHGTVLTAGDEPAVDALVSLIELRREVITDDGGRFVFDSVEPGTYLINVTSLNSGGATVRATVVSGAVEEVNVQLDRMVHSGTVSVTATGSARGLFEVVQPVDVLGDDELVLRRQATLGETLNRQAGVSSTGYGQGSSRPVIRGLGSERVRVLENGIDTGDVASIGPDHAVGSDPLAADRIEIVRGAGTLLYGPNALGGVVNVIDNRVPDRVPVEPLTGTVELSGGTGADQKSGSFKLDGGSGRIAWHIDGFAREGKDYTSPARQFDEADEEERGGDHEAHEEESVTGRVENTFTEGQGLTLGASFVSEKGYLGVSVSGFDTEYGVPGHHHHEHEHEEGELSSAALAMQDQHEGEELVHTELEQRRVDLHGQIDDPIGGIRQLQLKAGWRDYRHDEMEGDELGTRFENDFSELRLEAVLAPLGRYVGSAGLHWVNRDFAAAGEEAFVQPTDTTRLGVFLYEEAPPDPLGLQFGLRYEEQRTETVDPDLPDRDFTTWSAAGGIAYKPSPFWQLSLNLNRSERAPTAEELYSRGPHAATRANEIGDPSLSSEVGTGGELTFRAETDRARGWVSTFVTRFDDFIYLEPTGEVENDLEVYEFAQRDAEFRGFELHVGHELLHADRHHLHLELTYDQVRAELGGNGEPLPRIPPRRTLLALVYLGETIDVRLEGLWVDEQKRVTENETPTHDYAMLNASVSFRAFSASLLHEIVLRGTNLTNEVAYNHVSFLKTVAPLPGRDVSLVYRMMF